MARLPTPGGDGGNWGNVLNEYLEVGHNSDGTTKNALTVVNAKDYGTIGDGSTDDTAALRNAVSATLSLKGILFLPTLTLPPPFNPG